MTTLTRREALLAGLGFAIAATLPALPSFEALPVAVPVDPEWDPRGYRAEFWHPITVSQRERDMAGGSYLTDNKYEAARENMVYHLRAAGWLGEIDVLENLDMVRSPMQTAYCGGVRAVIHSKEPIVCGCGERHMAERPPPGYHLWWSVDYGSVKDPLPL